VVHLSRYLGGEDADEKILLLGATSFPCAAWGKRLLCSGNGQKDGPIRVVDSLLHFVVRIRVISAAEAAEAVLMEEAQLVREALQEGHFTVLGQVEASFQMREVYYNPLSCQKRTVSMSAKRLTSAGGQNKIYILVAAESGWANT
jgi:hypothetical protein